MMQLVTSQDLPLKQNRKIKSGSLKTNIKALASAQRCLTLYEAVLFIMDEISIRECLFLRITDIIAHIYFNR